MVALFKVSFVAFCLYFLDNNNCDQLSNGNYRVFYSFPSTEINSNIKIENNNFFQLWDNGECAKGTIKWLDSCAFRLEYLNPPTPDTSEMAKLLLLSFGEPYFRIDKRKGDTLFFSIPTYNLHVFSGFGMIIKIRGEFLY